MDNSVRYYAIYYIQKVPSWWNPKNECVLHHYSVGTEAEIKAEVEKLNAEKPAYWERNKCKELGVGLRVTSYHCFEDLYLSYEEISNMYKACKNADKVIIDVLD